MLIQTAMIGRELMRSVGFDRLLAGTAVALALGLAFSATNAMAQSANPIETTAVKSASTDATPTPMPAEATLADKLREMTAGKFDRILGGKKDRSGVELFYSARQFAPLWITDGGLNERGRAAIAYLAGVDADGLDPADYPAPQVRPGADTDALADAELRLTQAVVTFARHAQVGRVHFTRVSADILYEQVKPEPADVLGKVADSRNTREALDSFHPPHPGYKALKAKLAEARGNKGDAGPARVEHGPVLKYVADKKGNDILTNDPRVPAVRERLGLPFDGEVYDKALAEAVSRFQKQRGLPPTGQLTAATVDALNGPKRDRDSDIIIANMERWRWMPRELGKIHVIVNIPDFTLRLMRDGQVYWNTRVVVGKPNLATPIMSAEMKFITVNPTWNVPPSIIKNEYLPALAADPSAMERIGLKVATNPDGTVRIWQPPGDRNALGRIRFNFPNKFLVYQHDTPDKHLFAHDRRAYSHGCMRVQDPLMYGEKLLSLVLPSENYTAERLRKMFGSGEVNINFPQFIPVHLTYQSAYVDDAGKLVIREDIYGRDARLLANLKGSDRRVADLAVDRPKGTSTAPVRAPGGMTFGSSSGGGGSFLERLFGGPTPAPQQQRPRRASNNQQAVR